MRTEIADDTDAEAPDLDHRTRFARAALIAYEFARPDVSGNATLDLHFTDDGRAFLLLCRRDLFVRPEERTLPYVAVPISAEAGRAMARSLFGDRPRVAALRRIDDGWWTEYRAIEGREVCDDDEITAIEMDGWRRHLMRDCGHHGEDVLGPWPDYNAIIVSRKRYYLARLVAPNGRSDVA
jgi:hypothetical protein